MSVNQAYFRAGQITQQVKKQVQAVNWEGRSYLELCNFVEEGIKKLGGIPAFPCNVCANESAAHYTAEIDDQKLVPNGSILKVDLGVHLDGFIADTAVTLCYNDELLDMVEATRAALAEALKIIRAGVRTSEVGRVVQAYASRRGYQPISNLSGHSLEQYVIHRDLCTEHLVSIARFLQGKQGVCGGTLLYNVDGKRHRGGRESGEYLCHYCEKEYKGQGAQPFLRTGVERPENPAVCGPVVREVRSEKQASGNNSSPGENEVDPWIHGASGSKVTARSPSGTHRGAGLEQLFYTYLTWISSA
jgi:hypothetical protein